MIPKKFFVPTFVAAWLALAIAALAAYIGARQLAPLGYMIVSYSQLAIFFCVASTLLWILLGRLRNLCTFLESRDSSQAIQTPSRPIGDDISRIDRALKEALMTLEDSNKQYQERDKERRELIANLAHDLKAPLASVMGYLETGMSRGGNEASNARVLFDTAYKNAERMNQMIDELFETAKFDNLAGNVRFEPLSASDLLSEVYQHYSEAAAKAGITLKMAPLARDVLLKGEHALLERALGNLVGNACKFTPRNGSVSISGFLQEDTFYVNISDTGPGIPEDDLPHVFSRFFRSRPKDGISKHGSGLGLSIVKKIVEAHGGSVVCSSTLGHGTTFQVALPTTSKAEIADSIAALIGGEVPSKKSPGHRI